MKKFFVILCMLFVMPLVMGMGTISGGPTHKIPTPATNFSATITDSQGVTTKVTQISFDGKVYLTGYRGNATVTVPFEKISSVQVGKPEEDKKVSVFVTLKEGGTLNLRVDGKMPCYGAADFGNVQIEFKDLKKVDIEGVVAKGKP